ncbi:MAG: HYR domain-containing protein, partial [Bacteroidota bacterium]
NEGVDALSLGTISSSNADFSVTQIPRAFQSLPTGGQIAFVVTYNANTAGTNDATISIANNDLDENPYNFVVRANTEGTAPEFTQCPTTQVTLDVGTDCSVTPTLTNLGVTFNAGNPTAIPSFSPSSLAPMAAAQTVTVTATNSAGMDDCSVQVLVRDATRPTITNCPTENVVFMTDPDECGKTITDFGLLAEDNCEDTPPLTISITNPPADNFFPVGSTMVEARATDAAGNPSLTCQFTVEVRDNQDPVITCPSVLSEYLADVANCTASLSFTATATDNCGTPTIVYSLDGTTQPITFPYDFSAGETVVRASVGNVRGQPSCVFTVKVVDKTAPVVGATKALGVESRDGMNFLVDINMNNLEVTNFREIQFSPAGLVNVLGLTRGPDGFGYLSGLSLTSFTSSLYRVDLATGLATRVGDFHPNVITALAFDGSGQLWGFAGGPTTQVYRINVTTGALTAGPLLNEGFLSRAEWDPATSRIVLFPGSGVNIPFFAFDPVGETLTQLPIPEVNIGETPTGLVFAGQSLLSGTRGLFTVDLGTGTTTPLGDYLLLDGIITNLTKGSTAGLPEFTADCAITTPVPAPTVPDNCDGTVTGTTSDPRTFAGPGNYTINWTFTDQAGNSAMAAQTVTVTDDERPTITCPMVADSYSVDAGSTTASLSFEATPDDNCSGGLTVEYSISGSVITFPYDFPVGTTQVTARARDASGKFSDPCTFDVVVEDVAAGVTTFVWDDRNGDGIQDANEPGISGVFARLQADGLPEERVMTDANGVAVFLTEIPQGTFFRIVWERRDGYWPTGRNAGTDEALDSDAPNNSVATDLASPRIRFTTATAGDL